MNRSFRMRAAGAVVTVAAALLVPAVSASAARAMAGSACDVEFPENIPILGDIDGDGNGDLVVGVPGSTVNGGTVGGVDVHGTRSGGRLFLNTAIPALHASTRFGSAITEIDVDGDGCTDLVVGDPGHSGGGAVDVLFGSAVGLSTTRYVQIPARTPADQYGSAVTVDHYTTTAGATITDLWIGAPGRAVTGHPGAGAVDHYRLSLTGQVTFMQAVTATVARDQPSSGAHFGAVLSAFHYFDPGQVDVMAGVPDETVDGQADAGAVDWLSAPDGSGVVTSGQHFTRDSAGVPGSPHSGDRLGAAVYNRGWEDAGAPGVTVDGHRDAGMVIDFSTNPAGQRIVAAAITQATAGMPDPPAAGNLFGSAIASADQYDGEGSIWFGVPGATVDGQAGAGGAVEYAQTVDDQGQFTDTYTVFTEGGARGLGGTPHANDHAGASLSTISTDGPNMLIGVPGATYGNTVGAGKVITRGAYATGTPQGLTVGARSGLNYGTVLATPLDS